MVVAVVPVDGVDVDAERGGGEGVTGWDRAEVVERGLLAVGEVAVAWGRGEKRRLAHGPGFRWVCRLASNGQPRPCRSIRRGATVTSSVQVRPNTITTRPL